MAKKKKQKKNKAIISINSQKEEQKLSFFSELKLGESYTSLFLGIVVVIAVTVSVVSFVKLKHPTITPTQSITIILPTQIPKKQEPIKTVITPDDGSHSSDSEVIKGNSYTVKDGDQLWDIAVRAYGDGFKWTDIANANNLDNPDGLNPGQILGIPR